MGATPIDNNDADGKSGKLYGWLLIIRCTSITSFQETIRIESPTPNTQCGTPLILILY